MTKKVFSKEANSSSTVRLQQLAAEATDKQLAAAGIPTKYWKYIRKLSKYVTDRNEAAHNSGEQLARLLSLESFSETGLYEQWKPAFPIVYGKTIEELAHAADPTDLTDLVG